MQYTLLVEQIFFEFLEVAPARAPLVNINSLYLKYTIRLTTSPFLGSGSLCSAIKALR